VRSPYRQNALFLLDARADASVQEIRRLQNRAEVLLEMGKALDSTVLPFLRRSQTTREDILSAIQRLEDGQARTKEEIFWVHAGPKGDCLPSGFSLSALVTELEKSSHGSGRHAAIAVHNLAVINHALAFEQESAKSAESQNSRQAWVAAHACWRSVLQNEEFWDYMSERISSWQDPTVSESDVQRVKRELPEELLRPHSQLATEYIAAGSHASAQLHIQLIQDAAAWQPLAKRYLSEISTEIVRRAQDDLDKILRQNTEEALTPLQNDQKKEQLHLAELEIVRIADRTIANLSLFREMQEASSALGDQVGQCLRSVSIRYFNQLNDAENALRLLNSALKYASSSSCRALIARDQATVRCRSLCNLSLEAANQGQYKTAQEYLEQAKSLAPEGDLAQIEEWLATCKRNQIFEGVDTKHNTPTLRTVNGIGATFYGKRDYDPASNSYVTTHFFTFFFLPVIPLAAYRVVSTGGNSYRIFGKVPLSRPAIWYRRAVFAAVGVFILFSMIQSNGSSPPSSTIPMTTGYSSTANSAPATSSPSYSADESEKDAIDRTRQELDAREWALDREKKELDTLERQLDTLKSEVKDLESEYPDGDMTSDVRADYESKLAQYNGLVPVYNEKLTTLQSEARRYEQDVASFNLRVQEYNARQ
jgi:tetratricopeptide (TPR) repeat protein